MQQSKDKTPVSFPKPVKQIQNPKYIISMRVENFKNLCNKDISQKLKRLLNTSPVIKKSTQQNNG